MKANANQRIYLAREFYTVLDGGIRFKRFPFDLIEQVGATAKKLVMRKFPGLSISGSPLGTRGLQGNGVNEGKRCGRGEQRTRLILWKPYILS
jgi:hypothetical protein